MGQVHKMLPESFSDCVHVYFRSQPTLSVLATLAFAVRRKVYMKLGYIMSVFLKKNSYLIVYLCAVIHRDTSIGLYRENIFHSFFCSFCSSDTVKTHRDLFFHTKHSSAGGLNASKLSSLSAWNISVCYNCQLKYQSS